MTAKIIDGKGIAADLRGKVADAVHRLTRDRGIVPGLAVVLVGNNPASESYVASKMKMTVGSGMRSFDHRLPKETSEAELLGLIARLNADPSVHGILVQLPLPAQIDPHKIIAAVDPAKDVDGFSPVNAGRLCAGLPALAPCTPVGCILLAKTVQPSLAGLEAVSKLPGFEEAAAELPDLALVDYHLGMSYAATGRDAKAMEAFKRALTKAPGPELQDAIKSELKKTATQ